jgi:SPP1 family predicted phage head-tail adaptor
MDRTFEVLVKTLTPSTISDGQTVSDNGASYTVLLSGWCRVEESSGQEYLSSGRIETKRARKFTVRYSRLIKPIHFIRYDNKIYNIQNIAEVGRQEGLIITGHQIETENYIITGTGNE